MTAQRFTIRSKLFVLIAMAAVCASSATACAGWVYTSTNAASGNRVKVFFQAGNGHLFPVGSYSTGGTGTGGGLSNQGAVTLSENGRWLLVTNAGSDDVTAFRAFGPFLLRTDVESSGGDQPVSVTIHDRTIYVVNATGAGSIAGLKLGTFGSLTPIADSIRPLSGAAETGPAQVQFTPDGQLLVVTERLTNNIDTYEVESDDTTTGPNIETSAGMAPFGFAFTSDGLLVVSEAFGGMPDASAVSSYGVDAAGDINPITASAPTTETAACWIVITNNDHYAYTTNTGSGSVSGYRIESDGELVLLDADGVTAGTGMDSAPTDMALDRHSRYLSVLNSGTGEIAVFRVNNDGSLTPRDTIDGLPAGSTGLAAR